MSKKTQSAKSITGRGMPRTWVEDWRRDMGELCAPLFDTLVSTLEIPIPCNDSPVVPLSVEESRARYRADLESRLEIREELGQFDRGCQLIHENLNCCSDPDRCREELEDAMVHLVQAVEKALASMDDPPPSKEQLQENIAKLFLPVTDRAQPLALSELGWVLDEQMLKDEAPTLASCLGFSKASLHDFYNVGRWLYHQRLYVDASCLFAFLATLDPRNDSVRFCQGACQEELRQFTPAIEHYSVAVTLNTRNVDAWLALVRCHAELNQNDAVRETILLGDDLLKGERRGDSHAQRWREETTVFRSASRFGSSH